ncbi:hypothetical protein UFOVP1264_7 [uncultured Caudovirales phage]|uniref:Uncharacterized protein n=1 Tax=uncultured Caudovirales phage TaxID=2100421 RepID=A0A6J5RF14_9CAUD|nr:hypothetical protein UFOVP1264_7 [uncultured Caudovirales phage]
MYKINTDLVRRYAKSYAEMNMLATVTIMRHDAPALNTTSGDMSTTDYLTVYEGKARVTTVSGPSTYSLGEEPQYFSNGSVSIPLVDTDGNPTVPQINDTITVDSHHDALMIGRTFRVVDVQAAGQFEAARTMSVVGAQRWEGWNKDPNIPQEWYV